jgi:hypothetical protein
MARTVLIFAVILLLGVACSGQKRPDRHPASAQAAGQTESAEPAAAPSPGEGVPVALSSLTAPDAPGSYLLDVRTGRISRVSDLAQGLWAPDSRAIAFHTCCNGSPGYIDILDLVTATSARVATGDARDLSWSSDSIHLAYVPMDRNLAATGVSVVDRDGYNPHSVIDDAGAGEPRWLDNRRLAYSRGISGKLPTFFVVDSARPGVSTRLNPIEPPDAQDPRIVFGFPSDDGLWVVYYEGTYHSDTGQTLAWNRLTGEVRVLLPVLALGEFAPRSHLVRLFLPDPDKSGQNLNQVFDLDSGSSFAPRLGLEGHWSADGRYLVYESGICRNIDGSASAGLFAALPDGAGARSLTREGELEYAFAVSHVDSVVAYTALLPGAPPSYHLRVVALDGSSRVDVRLPLDPHLASDAWSPDGRYLLFTVGEGGLTCG